MRLEPFEFRHLSGFEPGELEKEAIGDRDLAHVAAVNRWAEIAYSIREGGNTLGFVAIIEAGGSAAVSFLLSDVIRRRPVAFVRAVRRGIEALEDQGVQRIGAEGRTDVGREFLARLGFVEIDGVYMYG